MAGDDAEWARGWLDALEPLRQPRPEVAELREAGVSEAHIHSLFPQLDLGEYSTKLADRLRNREVLAALTSTLLMSEASKLIALLPTRERRPIEAEVDAAANDLLDVIFAIPEPERPASFIPRVGFYLEDLNRALGLCQELFYSLVMLHLAAVGDPAFCAVATTVDLRVHRHRLARLVMHFTG